MKSKIKLAAVTAKSESGFRKSFPPVIVVPTTTDPAVYATILAAGYVAIPCDDPTKVVILAESHRLMADDMTMAAMHGVVTGGYDQPKRMFLAELYRRMKLREEPAPSSPPATRSNS